MTSSAGDEENPQIAVIARLGDDEFLIVKLERPTPDGDYDVYFDVKITREGPYTGPFTPKCALGSCNGLAV